MDESVRVWFAALPEAQRQTLQQLRQLVLSAGDGITEALKWNQPCYSRRALFCYLQKSRDHVTLGFQRGAALPDPHGLLQGSGKDMRHIRLVPGAALNEAALSGLIAAALALDAEGA